VRYCHSFTSADSAEFVTLQVPAAILALTVKLIESHPEPQAIAAVWRLLVGVGLVDDYITADCIALGASFEAGGGVALAVFVGHRHPIDAAIAAAEFQADVIRRPGQLRLFATLSALPADFTRPYSPRSMSASKEDP
jgi:hypothetical protein